MTNKAFLEKLASSLGADVVDVQSNINNMNALLAECMANGGTLSVQGFGAIEAKQKAERKMYNPTTKDYKIIPAKTSVGFKMSATLKEKINK